MFESSRERRTLQRIAPHLVRPLAFTWPVYRGARVPRWKLGAGLLLYDVLSLFRNRRHERLDARAVHASEPALRTEGLLGGARYWDASTDDVRLTLATVLSAQQAGAVVLNHASVVGLVQREGARRRRRGDEHARRRDDDRARAGDRERDGPVERRDRADGRRPGGSERARQQGGARERGARARRQRVGGDAHGAAGWTRDVRAAVGALHDHRHDGHATTRRIPRRCTRRAPT